MKNLYSFVILAMMLLGYANANAAVELQSAQGWLESGYVTWTKAAGYSYHVYVSPASADSWTKLDDALVREYPTYGRADAVGLKAGQYKFKVVPVKDGTEVTAESAISSTFTATAHDRGGFAHFKTACSTFNPANGIGAYKNDGTLKDNAKVIYVHANNAKTITTDVVTSTKGAVTKGTGFQNIISLYEKGCDKTPICFRIIGTIKASDMDAFGSKAEGVQIKGRNSYSELNITIEGIGNDATIHGFGFLIRNAVSVELRNFAVMWCMDDAVSMDTDNSNLWIHNLDLFYGKPGSAADQKKGDGTLDIKGDSQYCTLAYNHLWDSGKSSLCGMTSESGPNYLTYHHNWFDHSDSRHPRVRTMTVHVYNNYFDGNSKYGIGAAMSSNVFAENNYFRNCKYPMLTSKQGSDVHNGVGSSDETKGTFSGENGGVIKAYGNVMEGQKSFEPYVAGHATYSIHYDAYVASSREETVPSNVVALLGGRKYDNFDTDKSLMYTGYTCHAASEVKNVVTGNLGAGRCQHGDFKWTFGANEDNNDQVINELSKAINDYKSMLVGFFGQAISNGGATTEQGGSSNEGTEGGSSDSEGAGDDGGDDNNVNDYSGNLVVYFTYDGKALTCSDNSLVKVSGNGKKDLSVAFNGKTYTSAVKMESATSISIVATNDATITLVFDLPSKKFKLDGTTYTTDANGRYTFEAKKGTTYVLTKGDSMNLMCVAYEFAEGSENPTPGTPDDPTPGTPDDPTPGTPDDPTPGTDSNVLINYPAEKSGVSKQGSTDEADNTFLLKNGYVGTVDGVANVAGNGIKLTVDGGFKKGDVITIAGTITVKTSDAKYDTKITTTAQVATVDGTAATAIHTFSPFANTAQTGVGTAGDQTYTLTEDYPELWIVRSGGTTATITKITVTRPDAATAIANVSETAKDNTTYDLMGRRVSATAKGKVYILNGKKYVGK